MSAGANLFTPHKASSPPWLVTFVDLVFLLLAFFAMIFSMSQLDVNRYVTMAQSYAEKFNPGARVDAAMVKSRSYIAENVEDSDDLAYLEAALKAAFARSANLEKVQFRSNQRALVISLSGAVSPDGSAVAPGFAPALFDLGGVLVNIDNRLAVIGLADTSAESWAAALARSARIADALHNAGYDRPIAVLARAVSDEPSGADSVEISVFAKAEAGS